MSSFFQHQNPKKMTRSFFVPFQKAWDWLKANRFLTKAVTACLVVSLSLSYALFSSGFTLGLQVKYAGNIIATVKNADIFNQAKKIVLGKLSGPANEAVISAPLFQTTLTTAAHFDNADAVAEAIIENTNEIVEAKSVKVKGKSRLFTTVKDLNKLLEEARTRFETDGAENTSAFVNAPEIDTGYCLRSKLASKKDLIAFIYSLDVETVSTIRADSEIPYETQTVKTSEQYAGYSKTTTAGVNGICRSTTTVTSYNGVEIDRNSVEEEIQAPVTEIITVGTAVPRTTQQQRAVAQKSGFIFPLGGTSYTISTHFGEGNHKGIDLAISAGTPIYAVAGGTVVSSKYDGNYGNCVVIDHGNGIQTRYAHASVLRVSAGTVVKQGDLLALVGSTGQSTGNHLHFEVTVNGNRVNPAPYIGL